MHKLFLAFCQRYCRRRIPERSIRPDADKIKKYFKFQDDLNILDLGCSNGSFLEQFPKWNVYGIELEETTGRIAQSKHKNIFIGNMKDATFDREFFDCITINDALDHSNDPHFVIELCHSLLKPGGIVVIKVHNIDCLLATLTGKRFYAICPPGHLVYFNLKTLKLLLKKHQFEYLSHFYNTQKLRFDNAVMRAAASFPFLYPMQKIAESTFLGNIPIYKNFHDIITIIGVKPLSKLPAPHTNDQTVTLSGDGSWHSGERGGKTGKIANYLRYKFSRPLPVIPCVKYTPQIVHVMMTNRCNLRCNYCNASKSLEYAATASTQEMSLERIREAFRTPFLKNALLVDLLGGEPLLVPEIEDIVGFLKTSGHLTNMSTNGLLLPQHIEGLKNKGITRINVSIYPTNLALLKKTLADINKVFPVHTSYVLTRTQLESRPEEILDIVAFAQESRSKSLRFWMYRPMGINADLREIVTEDLSAYRAFHRNASARFKKFIFWPKGISTGPRRKRCRQLWQHVGIDPSGNIGICCGIDNYLPSNEANLFTTAADVIFNHPRTIDLRIKLLDPLADVPEECRHCNLLEDPGW